VRRVEPESEAVEPDHVGGSDRRAEHWSDSRATIDSHVIQDEIEEVHGCRIDRHASVLNQWDIADTTGTGVECRVAASLSDSAGVG
jgi:hypothetical protein